LTAPLVEATPRTPLATATPPARRAEAALRVLAQRDEAARRQGKDKKQVEAEIENELTHLAREINGAIRAGDFTGARVRLDRMEVVAPPQSLTLLRLRAWLAMSDGRLDEARRLYRQILNRLNDDENAGVNLAILEAQGGNRETALKILTGLSVRHPDSENIEAVRRMLGADTY
jgi:Flp pilus assembly protein TadD